MTGDHRDTAATAAARSSVVGSPAGANNLLTLAVTAGFVLFLLGDAGGWAIGAVPSFFIGIASVYVLAVVASAVRWFTESRRALAVAVQENRRLTALVLGHEPGSHRARSDDG
jgi:uncharacterized membrane protein YccC